MKGKMTQLGEGTVDLTTDQSPHRRTAGSPHLVLFSFLKTWEGAEVREGGVVCGGTLGYRSGELGGAHDERKLHCTHTGWGRP